MGESMEACLKEGANHEISGFGKCETEGALESEYVCGAHSCITDCSKITHFWLGGWINS